LTTPKWQKTAENRHFLSGVVNVVNVVTTKTAKE